MKTTPEDYYSFFGSSASTLPLGGYSQDWYGPYIVPVLETVKTHPERDTRWPGYNPHLEPYTVPNPVPQKPLEPIKFTTDKTHPDQAIKYDADKTDWSLMPWESVEEINKVLAFGAKKYAAHNWQQGDGFRYTRVLNSLLRHVFAYMRGEDNDPESGLSHMSHAGCNVLFLIHYHKNKSRYKNDDRYVQ